MTETAARLMQHPNTPIAPAGINQGEWNQYLADIAAAYDRLGVLQAALPDASHENQAVCDYRTFDNLSKFPTTRIKDLQYLPLQAGQVIDGAFLETTTPGQCSELLIACPEDSDLRLGRVLGWQGASIDNLVDDTHIWYRPTSAGFAGEAANLADQAFATGVGALFLPFVCLADLFQGKLCSFDDAKNLADKVNPIEELVGSLPGFGDDADYKYVGLWHFVDVAQPGGQFNQIRGILYENAGVNGNPGVIDIAIMAAADLTGMSLHTSRSRGVSRYGQFDETTRDDAHWQHTTLGHTEFSPVNHLAQYGWSRFVETPTSAIGLSWPLHALGDAVEPHHVAGTTSYGHRPFEDETDHLLDRSIMAPPGSCTLGFLADGFNNDPGQDARVLTLGFGFWRRYKDRFAPGQVPIQDIVLDTAQQALALTLAAGGGAYDDTASVVWHTGIHFDSAPSGEASADDSYRDQAPVMGALLELGSGAMIAFLTGASLTAKDPGPTPDQTCPVSFDPSTGQCSPSTPPPPLFIDAGDLVCAGGGCSDAGTQCGGASTCSTNDQCDHFSICVGGCCQEIPR